MSEQLLLERQKRFRTNKLVSNGDYASLSHSLIDEQHRRALPNFMSIASGTSCFALIYCCHASEQAWRPLWARAMVRKWKVCNSYSFTWTRWENDEKNYRKFYLIKSYAYQSLRGCSCLWDTTQSTNLYSFHLWFLFQILQPWRVTANCEKRLKMY